MTEERLLILDTCGERGSVALFRGGTLHAEEMLAERTASAALLGAVGRLLEKDDLRVIDLQGLGVVNGPGSFTGLRVGLAVAKGLCEASGLVLATVSRLAVLAEAAGLREGYAVLRAGPEQLYVRGVQDGAVAWERMMSLAALTELARVSETIYAEPAVGVMLGEAMRTRMVPLSAANALGEVQACLRRGGSDLAAVDANYVRDEGAIYRMARTVSPTGSTLL